jgi:hypothetical protein
MDYCKIYTNLIEKGRNRVLPNGVYKERHHIIPRCMGGNDNKNNLVYLTWLEHLTAHNLLVKMFPDIPCLVYAARSMIRAKDGRILNRKEAAWIRERWSKMTSERMSGRIISDETKIKMSQAKANISDKTRSKMSESAKSRIRNPLSEKTKLKISESLKGRQSGMKGKTFSEESRSKISENLKGKNTWSKGKKWSAESIAKREATRKRNKELKNLTSQ